MRKTVGGILHNLRTAMFKKAFLAKDQFMLKNLLSDLMENISLYEFRTLNNYQPHGFALFDDYQKTIEFLFRCLKNFHLSYVNIPQTETDYYIDEECSQQKMVLTDATAIRENRECDYLFGPAMAIFETGYLEGTIVWHYKYLKVVLEIFIKAQYGEKTSKKQLLEQLKILRNCFKRKSGVRDKLINNEFNKYIKDSDLKLLEIVANTITHSPENRLSARFLKEDKKMIEKYSAQGLGINLNPDNTLAIDLSYLDFLRNTTNTIFSAIMVVANRSKNITLRSGLEQFCFPKNNWYRAKLLNELFILVLNKELEKDLRKYHQDNIENKLTAETYNLYENNWVKKYPELKEKPMLYKMVKYIIDSYAAKGSALEEFKQLLPLLEVFAIIRNTVAYSPNNEIQLDYDLEQLKIFGMEQKKELIRGERALNLSKENLEYLIKKLTELKQALYKIR